MDPNNNNSNNPNNSNGTTPVTPSVVPVAPNPAPTVTPPEPTPPAAPAPALDPETSPAPAPKIVNETSKPKVFVSTGSHKNAFILGALAIFLLVGLGVSLFLVRQQQDIRSKATGGSCRALHPYPVYPTHLQDGVSTTPTFQWKYYEPDTPSDTECTGLTGYYNTISIFSCTTKGQNGFRTVDPKTGPGCKLGQEVDANSYPALPDDCTQVAWCSTETRDGQPFTELAPSRCWLVGTDNQPNYNKPLDKNPLAPNSEYWWTNVSAHASNQLMFCPGGAWRFQTASQPQVSASCQMVSADKDLTKVQIGDTVKFTGYGSVSSEAEKIDKINFIFTKTDGTEISNDILDAVRATDKDSGTNQFYVATKSAQISTAGSYSMRIRVHWQSADKWLE